MGAQSRGHGRLQPPQPKRGATMDDLILLLIGLAIFCGALLVGVLIAQLYEVERR